MAGAPILSVSAVSLADRRRWIALAQPRRSTHQDRPGRPGRGDPPSRITARREAWRFPAGFFLAIYRSGARRGSTPGSPGLMPLVRSSRRRSYRSALSRTVEWSRPASTPTGGRIPSDLGGPGHGSPSATAGPSRCCVPYEGRTAFSYTLSRSPAEISEVGAERLRGGWRGGQPV